MPQVLPRWAYQIVALAMLVLVYGITADLASRGVIPYAAVAARVGHVFALLSLAVGATFVWVLLVLPLRLISDAPAMLPPKGTDLRAAYAAAQADLQRNRTGTPAERRRYHVRMLLGSLAVGLACAVGVAANLELAPDGLWLTPIAYACVCAALVPYHALRALLAR